jgi:phosphoglycerate dehydrogenase-like enzyme
VVSILALRRISTDSHTITETLKRVTYLSTLFWLPPDPSYTPDVKFIQFSSAGINHVAKSPYYTDSKIPLLSANGVHGPQIAEWVVMMDLVHHHKYIPLYEQQREKKWLQKTGMGTVDRVGRRVGILGYGSIGRQGE